MWRNYWTVAVRALAKSKTYSIINIAGLAIGMAACILILLYIRYEESYDKWVPDVENTYELQAWYPHPDDGEPAFLQMSAYVSKGAALKDFPQIERAVYVSDNEPVLLRDGQAQSTKNWLFADDDFLKVVNLPLVAGSTLTAPETAVITQSEAIKRFGSDNVVGQTMTIITRGVKHDLKIVGVLKDVPKNSSLKINALVRIDFNQFYAVGVLQNAVGKYPGNPQLWVGLGNALVDHAGQLTPASEYAYQRAAEIVPGHPAPAFFMGLALVRSGDRDGALVLWKEILADAPANAGWRPIVEDAIAALEPPKRSQATGS